MASMTHLGETAREARGGHTPDGLRICKYYGIDSIV